MSEARPVLVTGASGFTGGKLVEALLRRGTGVRGLVRDASRVAPLAERGMQVVEGDITDREAVARATEGCGVVYHIAAMYRSAASGDAGYHRVNVEGTQHVLDAASRQGVGRVVHCSTAGVHGHVTDKPADEDAPYNPGDVYQDTKLQGEQRAQQAITEGQPVTIFRPGAIYGPGDLRLLKLFRMVQTKKFRMFGDGKPTYHLVYIDDLVEGILLCGEHPDAVGEVFLLVGDEYIELNEMVRIVADAVGVEPPRGRLPLWPLLTAAKLCETLCKPLGIEPPLHTRRCEFFIKHRAFTNAKARRVLGWSPRVSATEGLRRTAAWYFEQGHLKGAPPKGLVDQA